MNAFTYAASINFGDGRMASIAIGHADTKPKASKAVVGGEISQHGPRFELCIDLRNESGDTEVTRRGDRAWL